MTHRKRWELPRSYEEPRTRSNVRFSFRVLCLMHIGKIGELYTPAWSSFHESWKGRHLFMTELGVHGSHTSNVHLSLIL